MAATTASAQGPMIPNSSSASSPKASTSFRSPSSVALSMRARTVSPALVKAPPATRPRSSSRAMESAMVSELVLVSVSASVLALVTLLDLV